MASSGNKKFAATVQLEIDRALRDARKFISALDPASEEFDRIKKQIDDTARSARFVGENMNPKQMARYAQNARQVRNEAEDIAYSSGRAANAFRGQTLAAQNVLRIIQDMPYGIMGVANNVEGMADSFSNAKRQGLTFKQFATNLVTQLTTGPFAIATVISLITAFALSWDKVTKNVRKAGKALGLVEEEMAALEKYTEDSEKTLIKNFVGSLTPGEADRLRSVLSAFKDARGDELVRAEFGTEEGGFGLNLFDRDSAVAQMFGQDELSDIQQKILNQLQEVKGIRAAYEEIQTELASADGVQKDILEKLSAEFEKMLYGEEKGGGEDAEKDRAKLLQRLNRMRLKMRKDGLNQEIALSRLKIEQEHEALKKKVKELFPETQQAKLDTLEDYFDERKDMVEKKLRQEAEKERIASESQLRARANDTRLKQRKGGIIGGPVVTDAEGPSAEAVRRQSREEDLLEAQFRYDIQSIKNQRQTLADELSSGLINKKQYNSRLQNLQAQERLLRAQHAADVQNMEKDHAAEMKQIRMQRIQSIGNFVSTISSSLNTFGQAGTQIYKRWADARKKELMKQGKTEEEATKKVNKEGRKRFNALKAIYIAQATASTILAGVQAYQKGVESNWGPASIIQGAAMMTAALAQGYAQVRSLKKLKIGSSGAGGGASSAAAMSGKYTQLSGGITNSRTNNFMEQQNADLANPNNAGRLQETIQKEGIKNRAAMRSARAIGDDDAAKVKQRAEDFEEKAISG
ncbi:hypothetical protein [Salinibacter phage M8CC-19]|uniref:Uncharacterized protein n=2 Tax=Kryptosalinivirus M8CC19 TaxID=2560720 RepID=A0A2I6UGC4_9CAUD|nr:hypothetical protein FGG63_gp25 [Salinibacter phage M8CC-19]AUO78957.1 hypothetical protein [Salinibacter phage M8CC-19]AUO79191.1 hypothetical protein [Salinibacter phage M31CC-1]